MTTHNMDIRQAARFMGMVNLVHTDAAIACFEAKYAFAFWRPITAIRRADSDGNDVTVKDEAWEPLLGTPNHPEYPSAHSCITPATAVVVAAILGTDRIDFTMRSVADHPDRHFDTVDQLINDVANGRIYAGIHFRQATDDGVKLSRQVTAWVMGRYFQPVAPSPAAPAAPAAPGTGSGLRPGGESGGWELPALLAVIMVALPALVIAARRRR